MSDEEVIKDTNTRIEILQEELLQLYKERQERRLLRQNQNHKMIYEID